MGMIMVTKSKGKLSPWSYPIQCERNWKYNFLSVPSNSLQHPRQEKGRHVGLSVDVCGEDDDARAQVRVAELLQSFATLHASEQAFLAISFIISHYISLLIY